MPPFHSLEVPFKSVYSLWLRGGFPESFLAKTDDDSFLIRKDFIRTYLEREILQFGPRVPSEALERLWMMLAHSQGTMVNVSQLVSNISTTSKTLTTYIDLLCDLLLVRRLQPFYSNIGKRLVKTPKVYIRDSGVLHALLGIKDMASLLGHPIVGQSFEGFVIENILSVVPAGVQASFYRTAAGAEIDLILEFPNKKIMTIEIKSGLSVNPRKGFYSAIETLQTPHNFIVYSGKDSYPIAKIFRS